MASSLASVLGARRITAGMSQSVRAAKNERHIMAQVDRERLCNDTMNTGVVAALVGGFALGNVTVDLTDEATGVDVCIYMLSVLAVHACTCSALCSALLYRVVNSLEDDSVAGWAASHKKLLHLPIAKFGMGCVSYLISVVFMSWRALEPVTTWRYMALIIGVGSVSSVAMTTWIIFSDQFGSNRVKPVA